MRWRCRSAAAHAAEASLSERGDAVVDYFSTGSGRRLAHHADHGLGPASAQTETGAVEPFLPSMIADLTSASSSGCRAIAHVLRICGADRSGDRLRHGRRSFCTTAAPAARDAAVAVVA